MLIVTIFVLGQICISLFKIDMSRTLRLGKEREYHNTNFSVLVKPNNNCLIVSTFVTLHII